MSSYKYPPVQTTNAVSGPDSAADNRIARFDGTTGELIQSSTVSLSDLGVVSGMSIDADNNPITNIEVADLKSGVLDTDLSSVAATDTTLPSAKATKAAIDTEASARSAADTTLQTNINTEASTRGTADTTLQGNIDDEETRALAAESGLQDDIDDVAADLATHAADTSTHGVGEIVGRTEAQTLTNKTLTSPVINSPTGIVKGDVGLGNVDNTSDATKDAASVTLTNKTLTSPVINTGISGTAIVDEDAMTSDSSTKVPTQQSVKAYVDTATGAAASKPNTIINGGMHLFQRSTSIAAINDQQMAPDRFRFRKVNTGAVYTMSKETTIIPTAAQAGAYIPASIKMACTTADASVAATDTVSVQYCVEGYDYGLYLHGKACRLQFWVYSNKTGTYCVAFRNSAQDRVYVAEYTIDASATWELKTIDITFDSSGTWLFDNGIGLVIDWTLMAGSTSQTTDDSWNSVTAANNVKATANQVNFSDANTNVWYLTGVQLVPGSYGANALPFFIAGDSFPSEVAKCQRYYATSYNIGTAVATVTDVGCVSGIIGTTSTSRLNMTFPVFMRTTPSCGTYDPTSGTNNAARMGSSSESVSQVNIGMRGYGISGGGSLTDTSQISAHFAADAELLATL